MSYDTARPYIASYVIIRQNGKVAFVLRGNTDWMNDHYGLPSGKVENGESFLQAAVREAKEEIGIDVKQDDLRHILTMHRHEPGSHATDWVDLYFEAKQWSGEPYNAEPHVHTELAWLDPKNLPDNTIESVKWALEQINNGMVYAEYGY